MSDPVTTQGGRVSGGGFVWSHALQGGCLGAMGCGMRLSRVDYTTHLWIKSTAPSFTQTQWECMSPTSSTGAIAW